MNMLLTLGKKIEMKAMKDYYDLYFKCNVLLLVYVFENFRNNSLQKLRIISKSLFEHNRFKLEFNA